MTAPQEPLAEIKQLYFSATKATIHRDLAKAVSLLRRIADEDERQRAAVLHGRPVADAIGMGRAA